MLAVSVPGLNPNEDRATLVRLFVGDGQHVQTGTTLCEIETTKALLEIKAPVTGYIAGLSASAGESVSAGSIICWIAEGSDQRPSVSESAGRAGSPRITKKAQALAEKNSIDWRRMEVEGIISEKNILAVLLKDRSAASSARKPAKAKGPSGGIPLVILGGGGHAAVLIALVGHNRSFTLKGILDPNLAAGSMRYGVPVLGGDEILSGLTATGPHAAALAFGLINRDPAIRLRAFETCVAAGLLMPPLVHERANVSPSAMLGRGVQVHIGAVVGPNAVLGDGVVVNTNAVISHDAGVGAHTHVAPGALVAGGVKIGERCLIGMGVTILNLVEIGDDCIVNNGKQVFASLPSGFEAK